MTQLFDAAAFMQSTFDEANDTSVIPVPAEEYPGMAEKVDVVAWNSPSKGTSGLKLSIIWEIMDDGVREITGRSKNTVRQDIMLDLTEQGNLDMSRGKNSRLGKLREALDLNKKGESFGFPMIQGRVAKLKISHRIVGEEIYAEVSAVTAQ